MNIYPLTPEQRYFYDCQNSAPESVMCSYFPYLGRLKDCVNMERFADCVMKTLHVHPAHLTVIEEHGGIPCQRYVPDLITGIPIERISEAELMTLKDDLIQPFHWGEAMCRFRLFITEKGKYFFFDDHNIICDGFGKILFWQDIQRVYDGQDLEPDSWFAYLQEREASKSSPHYEESRKWYEENYGTHDFCGYPHADYDSGGRNGQGVLRVSSGLNDDSFGVLKQWHLTRTEFFLAVSLLATAEYNLNPSVLITWCSKGRWKKEYRRSTGMMTQDMPAFLNVDGLTPEEIASSVREQVKGCMLHHDYPYMSLDERMLADDNLCFLYQGRLYTDGPVIPLSAGMADMKNKYSAAENILDVEAIETDLGIDLLFDYNAGRYKRESIERFAGLYIRILHDALRRINTYA